MASSGMLCRVAIVRAEVSEELNASFIRMTRIGGRFLQDQHGVISQKTAFFIVTAVKNSNLPMLLPVQKTIT
jgi:hypothetical protein